MPMTNQPAELYTEAEVAGLLNISIEHLYSLLDEHIFNDGSPRPASLTFTNAELALLGFWYDSEPNAKVLRMPRRD